MLEQSVLGKVWLAGGGWLCEQLCYEQLNAPKILCWAVLLTGFSGCVSY